MNFNTLSSNRFFALEETRKMLGLKKSEWQGLLSIFFKSDNGWIEFAHGDLLVTFEKYEETDKLHLEIKKQKNETIKRLEYTYDLRQFAKKKISRLPIDCNRDS